MNWATYTVWQVPAYLPYLQPPLTEEVISETEQLLGVQLPEQYLTLLRQQNGGYVRLTLPDSVHSMIWGIGPNFPTITSEYPALDPSNAEDGQWVPRASERLIPFDGDGHWYLCFDYRGGPNPQVAYIDLETEHDSRVASSFEEFLVKLRPDPAPNRLLVAGPGSIDEVAVALARLLKTRFEPADSDAHGYPIRRGALGTKRNPQWVWVSPNEVPRGFVRPTDRRYGELKDLLPGTALRLPDHPEAKVIVDCTDDIAQFVREACHRASFRIINEQD